MDAQRETRSDRFAAVSAAIPGIEEAWDCRGSSRERAFFALLAGITFLAAVVLYFAGFLTPAGRLLGALSFFFLATAFVAVFRFAILDPLALHRLLPFGHPPTPEGVRLTAGIFMVIAAVVMAYAGVLVLVAVLGQ